MTVIDASDARMDAQATLAARGNAAPTRFGEFAPADIQAEMSRRKKLKFLEYLSETGSVRSASSRAGFAVSTIHNIRRADPQFQTDIEEAYRRAVTQLRDTAMEIAIKGRLVDVWYKGEIVGQEVDRDLGFLWKMLERLDPDFSDKSGDKSVNVNVNVGVALLPSIARDEGSWEREAAAVHAQQKLLPPALKPSGTILDAKPIRTAAVP